MSAIFGKAYAKINLSLDVGVPGKDGFHPVRTVMQKITLCDDVLLDETDGDKVTFSSNLSYLPGDERNNAVKAAVAFYRGAGIKKNLHIQVAKRIPVAGGLGGSSTDAAAVLELLSKLHPGAYSEEELSRLAATLGSDTPFFLMKGTALAEGRGTDLTRVSPMPDCWILVAREGYGLNTGAIYAAFDSETAQAEATNRLLAALQTGSLQEVGRSLSNHLMAPAVKKAPGIETLCRQMLKMGALGSTMSGSGSCVFGIFDTQEKAIFCREIMSTCETFLCKPLR